MVVPVTSLWLPILLSAVAVFLVSSVLHMVLRYHRSDYRPLPDEAATLAALRRCNLAPGLYHFPFAHDPKDLNTPEHQAKLKEGPVGMMSIMPSGPMGMGKFLTQWFGYCVLVSIFVGYLLACTLPRGTDYLHVFRVAGSAAFLAYGLANIVDSIWKGYRWGMTAKNIADGVIYSLVTAGFFGWLHPR